jgi:DNA-binding response OmpR family regulator
LHTDTQDNLLIVDDNETLAQMVKRSLEIRRGNGDRIFIATVVAEAETILKTENITVLMCDYDLGPCQPRGTSLTADWRRRFPSIENAFIYYSGGNLSEIPKIAGVDAIFSRTSMTWVEDIGG